MDRFEYIIMNCFYHLQKISLLTPIGLISYFAPIQELMLAVAFLMLVDTITGIWAAYISGERIHSKKTRQFVPKFIAYMLALILAFVFDNHIIASFDFWTTRAIAFILASIELQSNFENLYKATGIKLWDRLKHLFSREEYEKRINQ